MIVMLPHLFVAVDPPAFVDFPKENILPPPVVRLGGGVALGPTGPASPSPPSAFHLALGPGDPAASRMGIPFAASALPATVGSLSPFAFT